MKILGSLVSLCLIAAACTSTSGDPATSTAPPATIADSSTTTRQEASSTTQAPSTTLGPIDPPGLVGALPENCDGIGAAPAPDAAEITFVIDGRLYAANPDGSDVRCLTKGQFPTQWGGAADRVLVREDGVLTAVDEFGSSTLAVQGRFEGESWTRPTGSSVVGIADDGRVVKYPIDGGDPVDLSFLARHDEVIYHPAGTHVLVVGESADGTYGIWLATNIGTEPELLIEGTTATLSFPSVSHDGLFLQFIAEHEDGTSHVHQVFLPDAGNAEFDASIALETSSPLSNLMVSPYGVGELAVAQGTCGTDLHTVFPFWPETEVLPQMESRPIGFLPGEPTRLLVAAYPELCRADSPVDLYIVDALGEDEPVLVVGGIDAFALPGVRAPLPDPPPPPGEFSFDDFA